MSCRFDRGVVWARALAGAIAVLVWCRANAEPRRGGAQETTNVVSLETLVSEALARNPDLRAGEASVRMAQGEVLTAKSYPNPELSFTPGVKHLSLEANDTFFRGAVEAGQLIEFPGKRAVRKAIAERGVAASRVALAGLRHQVELAVKRAYYDLLAAQQIEELRREQVASAQVFAEASRRRTQAGYASDFEIIKAESDLINAQKLLREAEGRTASGRLYLNSLAVRPSVQPLRAAGTLDDSPLRASVTNLTVFALDNNPALKVQLVLNEKAGLNVEAARLSRKPDFTIGPVIEAGKDEQVYGLGLSLPLPLWNQRKGEIATASAEKERALAETDKLTIEIVRAVDLAEQRLMTANAQLALYTPEFRSRLRGLVEQAERSYAQSATTLLIYLDARRTYFDSLADYNENLARAAEARAELESAVGVPLSFVKP